MSTRRITAYLGDDAVSVKGPGTAFSVTRRDRDEGASGCPIDYLAGALGS